MTRYGIFRGDKLVGRTVYKDFEKALKEKNEWNKQFEEFNKESIKLGTGKFVIPVEVKEYRKKRQTAEQKLKDIFS